LRREGTLKQIAIESPVDKERKKKGQKLIKKKKKVTFD